MQALKSSLQVSGKEADQGLVQRNSFARHVAGGTIWSFLAFGAAKGIGLGTTLVLARLLTPHDFGLVGFAMILIGAFTLLQDLGVPQAIIYSQRDNQAIAGTALTINVFAAILLFGLTALAAPYLAALDGEPGLTPVVTALALGLVISSIGSVQNAVMMKKLAFRAKFLPDVVPLVVSGVVSISLAVLGYGVWSLVYGYLAKCITTTLLLWALSDVRCRPGFERTIASDLLHYGLHVSFATILGFMVMNIDYFIIGYRLSSTDLGIYTMAFVFASLPSTAIGQVVARTVFPAYSRIRHDSAALIAMFSRVFHLVSLLSIALGISIYVCAPSYIPMVLGTRWHGVIEPLQWLIAFGVLRSIEFTVTPIYRALGRPDVTWKFNLFRLVTVAPAIWLGVHYGIIGVAIVQIVVALLFLPIHGVILFRLLNLSSRDMVSLLAPHITGITAVGLLATMGSAITVIHLFISGPIGSVLYSALIIGIYAGIVVWPNPSLVNLKLLRKP